MTTNFIHEYVGTSLAPNAVLGNSDGVAKVRVKFPGDDNTVDIRFALADDTAVNFRVDLVMGGLVPPALDFVTLLKGDGTFEQVEQVNGGTNSAGPNRFSIYAAAGSPALPDNSGVMGKYQSANPADIDAGAAYIFRVKRKPSDHSQAVDYIDFTLTVNASGAEDATPGEPPLQVLDPATGRRGAIVWNDEPQPIHGHGSGRE